MDTVVCPYCNCEVGITQVEAEEGSCPECGSVITPSTIFGNPLDDVYEDDYDDDDDKVFKDDGDDDFIDKISEDDEFFDEDDEDDE